MTDPTTVSIKWVSGGRPFVVSPASPTSGAMLRAAETRLHYLKEGLRGLSDVPEKERSDLAREAEAIAALHAAKILVHDVLHQADPTLRASVDEVVERLTADEFGRILAGLRPASKGGEPAGPGGPLPP